MHPINKVLYQVGVTLERARGSVLIPAAFRRQYRESLATVEREARERGIQVHRELRYEGGSHPRTFIDQECTFASTIIARTKPERLLDIGSYRHFILGLLAGYEVTTLDVREREPSTPNERVVTTDAKAMSFADGSFDLVVSLCGLEHFGLGRYGDDFDFDADTKAIAEMKRVLKPGGRLVFSTTITAGPPQIVFNAHRIYTYSMLEKMCAGLEREEEAFYKIERGISGSPCRREELQARPEVWDVYLGCWKKPA